MTHPNGEDPPQIDGALDPIRAAIQMVADGSAQRVTVYSLASARLMPAARVLARESGVVVEGSDDTDIGAELAIEPTPARIA